MFPSEWGFLQNEHNFNLKFQKVVDEVVLTDTGKVCFFPPLKKKIFITQGKKKN